MLEPLLGTQGRHPAYIDHRDARCEPDDEQEAQRDAEVAMEQDQKTSEAAQHRRDTRLSGDRCASLRRGLRRRETRKGARTSRRACPLGQTGWTVRRRLPTRTVRSDHSYLNSGSAASSLTV